MSYNRKKDIEFIQLALQTKAGVQDVQKLMVKIVIYEDMYANGLTAEMTLLDSEALQEMLPLVGDEKLLLTFRSAKEEDRPFPLIKLVMPIKGIENKISTQGSVKQYYTLTFKSTATETNERRRLNRMYNDKESGIAADVFENVLGLSNFETENTKWKRKIVIPNWTPYEVLDYMAKGSVRASGYPASNYMWWEDRDKHYFKSIDKIMEDGPVVDLTHKLTGQLKWDNDPNYQENNISEIKANKTFNDTTNTMNGMFASEFIGQDIIKRKLTHHKWDYNAEYAGSVQIDGGNEKLRSDFGTEEYVHQNFEPWQEGDPDYNCWKADDYVKRRMPMMQQFDNYTFVCTLPGDTNIKMGVVANLPLPSMSHRNDGKDDEVLKGNWVITRIRHELNQRQHTMLLELRKPHLKSFGPQKIIKDDL